MKKIFTMLLIAASSVGVAAAQSSAELYKKEYNLDKTGLAIKGYDPISYFTANKAQEGKKNITLTTEALLTVLLPCRTGIYLKTILQNISLSMAAGALMPWVLPEKR